MNIIDQLLSDYNLLKAEAEAGNLPQEFSFLLDPEFQGQVQQIADNKEKIVAAAEMLAQQVGEENVDTNVIGSLVGMMREVGLIGGASGETNSPEAEAAEEQTGLDVDGDQEVGEPVEHGEKVGGFEGSEASVEGEEENPEDENGEELVDDSKTKMMGMEGAPEENDEDDTNQAAEDAAKLPESDVDREDGNDEVEVGQPEGSPVEEAMEEKLSDGGDEGEEGGVAAEESQVGSNEEPPEGMQEGEEAELGNEMPPEHKEQVDETLGTDTTDDPEDAAMAESMGLEPEQGVAMGDLADDAASVIAEDANPHDHENIADAIKVLLMGIGRIFAKKGASGVMAAAQGAGAGAGAPPPAKGGGTPPPFLTQGEGDEEGEEAEGGEGGFPPAKEEEGGEEESKPFPPKKSGSKDESKSKSKSESKSKPKEKSESKSKEKSESKPKDKKSD